MLLFLSKAVGKADIRNIKSTPKRVYAEPKKHPENTGEQAEKAGTLPPKMRRKRLVYAKERQPWRALPAIYGRRESPAFAEIAAT